MKSLFQYGFTSNFQKEKQNYETHIDALNKKVKCLEMEKKVLENQKSKKNIPKVINLENSKEEDQNFADNDKIERPPLKRIRKSYSLSFKYQAILQYEEKPNFYAVDNDLSIHHSMLIR